MVKVSVFPAGRGGGFKQVSVHPRFWQDGAKLALVSVNPPGSLPEEVVERIAERLAGGECCGPVGQSWEWIS